MGPKTEEIQPDPMDVRLGRGKSYRKNPGNALLQGRSSVITIRVGLTTSTLLNHIKYSTTLFCIHRH